MMRRPPARRRAAAGRLALVLSGVLLTAPLVACGDDDGTTLRPPSSTTGTAAATIPTTAPVPSGGPEIVVRLVGGQPEGGVRRHQVVRGARVRIAVTSDRADEAHLHGYDLYLALPAGQTAVLEFTADVPGVFELETHETPRTILELEVR